jgi:hypothetical protein
MYLDNNSSRIMVTKHRNISLYFLQLNQVVVQILVWILRLAGLMKGSPVVLKEEISFKILFHSNV